MIDLTMLYSNATEEINFDGEYNIPKEIINDSRVIELDKVTISNSRIFEIEGEYELDASISGKMKINDSVTLEEVWYPFNIEIMCHPDTWSWNSVEKDKKSLDIIEFLWQNIVLEVPLRYTVVSDYSKYQGDGWKLVSEEELGNNPFMTLLNNEDRSD